MTDSIFSRTLKLACRMALALFISGASFSAIAQTLDVIYSFAGTPDGQTPTANMVMDDAGNLYGTTYYGGQFGLGCVFEVTTSGQESVLYSFEGGDDGKLPRAGVVLDSAGNLYGATTSGGTGICQSQGYLGCGTVFELTQSSGVWSESILYDFNRRSGDGAYPFGGVVLDGAGNLYGTTWRGGSANEGAVFELAPPSVSGGPWTETILHDFSHHHDGEYPEAGLVLDSAGNLYGTTVVGGEGKSGVVFELTPGAGGDWTETILHSFNRDGQDGVAPESSLVIDGSGNLYGTTSLGGTTRGIVFKLTAPAKAGENWNESLLWNLPSSSSGALALDPSGNVYGTTINGGKAAAGTVFELLAPVADGAWIEKTLYTFRDKADGTEPAAGVTLDAAGNLFGTTDGGGANNRGEVFEITP